MDPTPHANRTSHGEFGPIALGPNQPRRFYRGGPRIAAFRQVEAADNWSPEDWVASTTTLFGSPEMGLTRLPSGAILRDAIAGSPAAWLGEEHVGRYGADPSLLVKLLDAGQRLPVHAHPDGRFAVAHGVSSGHGKNEAWYILRAEPGAVVHLGFLREIGADELAGWVAAQDNRSMLGAMHRLPVQPGDAVFVPAGLPHAIGDGILLVETQEPTDLSVLMEWTGFDLDGERDGHLGLGFDVALACVDRRSWTAGQIGGLVVRCGERSGSMLPAAADAHFRIEREAVDGARGLEAGFSVVVVVAGAGELAWGDDAGMAIRAGMTLVVPHACGRIRVSGLVDLLRCRPPVVAA